MIMAGSYLIASLIGVWERDNQAAIYASIGLFTGIGIILYLSQGIFLFKFQPGSTHSTYLISLFDMLIFLISILVPILIITIPNSSKLWNFYKIYKDFIIPETFQEIDNFSEGKSKKH